MTNRQKVDALSNKELAMFISEANWNIRDIAEWLEQAEDEDFWEGIGLS